MPRLVIGVPVGFVNVASAKEEIIESGMSYIVARGEKGRKQCCRRNYECFVLYGGR